MKQVFVVYRDLGNEVENYFVEVLAVFENYRKASEWLMEIGYKPFYYDGYTEKKDLKFNKVNNLDDDRKNETWAWIKKFEVM